MKRNFRNLCRKTFNRFPSGKGDAWRRVLFTACLAACFGLFSAGAWATSLSSENMSPPNDTKTLSADTYDILGVGATQHAFYSSGGDIRINTSGNVIFDGTGALNTAYTNLMNGSLIYNNYGPDNEAGIGNIYLGTTGGNITVQNFETAMGVTPGAGALAYGGAIYSEHGDIFIGNGSGTITLSNNTTDGVAAAVYTHDDDRDTVGDHLYNGKVTINGSTINITGNHAEMHSGAIYTGKEDAHVTIGNNNSIVTIDGNTAKGSGGAIQAAWGQVLISGREITLTDNHVTEINEDVTGNNGTGPSGSGSGGVIMASKGAVIGNTDGSTGKITISGNSAIGRGGAIFVSNRGVGDAIIKGRTIEITGNTIYGMEDFSGYIGGGAIYANRDIDIDGRTILLSGNTAEVGNGGALEAERHVIITGSMVAQENKALGDDANGTYTGRSGDGGAIWAGRDVTLNATTGNIEFLGNEAAGDGGAIRAGGNVTLNATGGNIIFRGNSAGDSGQAIWFQGSNNSFHTDAVATFNAAAGRTITFFDSIENNPTPMSGGSAPVAVAYLLPVNKTGSGAVIFDGADGNADSPIYGATTVEQGAFVVRNGAVYGSLRDDHAGLDTDDELTSFTVNSGATLAGGGDDEGDRMGTVRTDQFYLQGILDISGSSTLSGSPVGNKDGGYSTFNLVTGDGGTINLNDGTILFNTYLNDGGTQLTDKLVLHLGDIDIDTSTTTGTATIFVKNTGVSGALTTGDGIMLVETLGEYPDNYEAEFVLGGRVVGGAYEYLLYQGDIDGNSEQANNWFLRSDGSPREETSHYPPLAAMALIYGRDLIGTLHERVGDEEDIRGRKDLHEKTPKTGGWARVLGNVGKQDGDLRGSSYGDTPEYKYNFFGLQVGHDLYRAERDNGSRNHLGLSFGYGRAKSDSTHVDGAQGYSWFEAYSLGGYWTYFGKSAWYVDTVLQGTYYTNMRSSAESGHIEELDTHAWGIAASVEGGKPFRNSKGWFVEPQAQLIYQYINISDARDAGARIVFDDVDSFVGRIGARFGRSWMADEVRQITVWVRPNIWHEFRGDSVTKFSSDDGHMPFRADLGGTTGEINVGFNGQMSPTVTLYVNASYTVRFDGDGHGYHGQAGLRWNW